jgi:rare lipoprotein A
MKILSENSILNELHGIQDRVTERTVSTARRVVAIAIGATVAVSIGLTSVHASQPGRNLMEHFHPVGTMHLTPSAAVVVPATATVSAQPGHNKVKAHSYGWHQVGLASWYGGQFQGRPTANGEIFNMNELSCAHRTLPLGTWVKVTNLHNHKWVVLRVNDRGPVPETRVVDLSRAAADLLGMRTKGITRVRLDVIDAKQAVVVARVERLRAARAAAAAAETVPVQATAANLPQVAVPQASSL